MKFTKSAIVLLYATTSAVAAVSSTLRAHRDLTHRRLDSDDDDKVDKKHKCELETDDGEGVEFKCKSKTENDTTEMEDEIKFKISQDKDGGVKVKVEYKQDSETKRRKLLQKNRAMQEGGTVEEMETETSFEVVFDRVIEYSKPTASSGGRRRLTPSEEAYDWETDEIVSEVALTEWSGFTPVEMSSRRLQDGAESGDVVYTFSMSTLDNMVKFDFTIAQDSDGASIFSANSLKIDFTLTDYPYVGNGTNVALMSSVESKQEIGIEYADEEEDNEDETEEDEGDEEGDMEDEGGDEEEDVEPIDEGSDLEEESEGEGRRKMRRLKKKETEQIVIPFGDALASGIMPLGEFLWAKEATVTISGESEPMRFLNENINATDIGNGNETETIKVVATTASDNSERLAFSFVGGEVAKGASSIYWDPETGVSYSTVDSSSSTAFTLSFGSFGMMFALALGLVGMPW